MPQGSSYAHIFQDRTTAIMVALAAIFAAGSVGWLVYAVVQQRMHMAEEVQPPRILTAEEKKQVLEQLARQQPIKNALTADQKIQVLEQLAATPPGASEQKAVGASFDASDAAPTSAPSLAPARKTLSAEEKLKILEELSKHRPSDQ